MPPGSISTSGSYECSSVHSTQFDRDAASTIVLSEPSITQSMASAGSEPPAPDVFSRTMDEVRNIHPLLLISVFYVSSCSRMCYCRANRFFSKADRPGIQNPVVWGSVGITDNFGSLTTHLNVLGLMTTLWLEHASARTSMDWTDFSSNRCHQL